MNQAILDYWDGQWLRIAENKDFETYSQSIPNDFIRELPLHLESFNAVKNATRIMDFGFGTGHMVYTLSHITKAQFWGVEISGVAVGYATAKYGNSRIRFIKKDILNGRYNEQFDLIVTSNVLEHFKDSFAVIDFLLSLSKKLMILVPNGGTAPDGYQGEGGAGHVVTFTKESFGGYEILDSFTFFSDGWTEGTDPLQLCILLKGKL